MSRFKLRLFLFLAVLALSEQNEIQSEFDEALNQFAKRERPEFKFPKRRLADKKIKQSFKRSSRSAMQLNDLYDLQRKFTKQKEAYPVKFLQLLIYLIYNFIYYCFIE